jgi:hypothetical protein
MRNVPRPRLTYANVMSTVAVMLALGGTSYAAFNLPNNSVTSPKIKDGAVHSSDLGNGAVTSKKLANNAVTSGKLANQAVTSGKLAPDAVGTPALADAAVTGSKLAPASITESDITPGSLTGQAFACATGDEGLDNRHECFFAVGGGGLTWQQAVAQCRARGATPATLASPAEIEAAAALGGSPFATGTFWTGEINTGGAPSAATAWAVEVSGGAIVDFLSAPLTSTTIPKGACVYHAADES